MQSPRKSSRKLLTRKSFVRVLSPPNGCWREGPRAWLGQLPLEQRQRPVKLWLPHMNPTSSPGKVPSSPGHCPCRNCQSPTVPSCWRLSSSACRATVRSSPCTSSPKDTSFTFRTRTETWKRRLSQLSLSLQPRAYPLHRRKLTG